MNNDPDSDRQYPDFNNLEIAFRHKSNQELKRSSLLFQLMNNGHLVNIGTQLSRFALALRLPLASTIIKHTIFKQFCGGTSLVDCQDTIDDLYKNDTLTLLDYGVESKSEEEETQNAFEELRNAIDFAASNESVPAAICKLTALIDNAVLEKLQTQETLSDRETKRYQQLLEKLHDACRRSMERGVSIFIDAEESWMQDTIDDIALELIMQYNRERVTVYNTYQMYRKDGLTRLKRDYEKCQQNSVKLGAKLVRGAYMDKERQRAQEQGYPSPIHETKQDTDHDFDQSLLFCLDRYQSISFVCASHNISSNQWLANEVIDREIPRDHPHINFSQLQGMSDNITFNLARHGFNVAKYVVYGPVREVLSFLIRRAQENTAVTGEMSRELGLIKAELKRRKNG